MSTFLFVVLASALVASNSWTAAASSDVASKMRSLLQIECSSFDECVERLEADNYRLVVDKLAGLGATVVYDQNNRRHTIDIPRFPISLNVSKAMLTIGVSVAKTTGGLDLSIPADTPDPALVTLVVEEARVQITDLQLQLLNPSPKNYGFVFKASPLNCHIRFSISVSGESLISLSATVLLTDLDVAASFGLETNQAGALQISQCKAHIAFGKGSRISSPDPSVARLVNMANLMLSRLPKLLKSKLCDQLKERVNPLLARN